MNSFYKEQQKLHQKAFDTLMTIEAHEMAANEIRESGAYEESEIERHSSARIQELRTLYALTFTTLMQNFCVKMGFALVSTKPYFKEYQEAELVESDYEPVEKDFDLER